MCHIGIKVIRARLYLRATFAWDWSLGVARVSAISWVLGCDFFLYSVYTHWICILHFAHLIFFDNIVECYVLRGYCCVLACVECRAAIYFIICIIFVYCKTLLICWVLLYSVFFCVILFVLHIVCCTCLCNMLRKQLSGLARDMRIPV